MEAPPGQKGKYSKADSAWGGCDKSCPPGGIATCVCPNGVPTTGNDCNKHGSKGCKGCKAGFVLNKDKTACAMKMCKCANGKGTAGTSCKKHGASMCKSCDKGFNLSKDKTMCLNPGASCCQSSILFQCVCLWHFVVYMCICACPFPY